MEEDVMSLKEGLLEEVAYHLEEIDKLANGSKEQQVMVQDLKLLVDALNTMNQAELNAMNESERREIERIKNEKLYELEKEKSKLGWSRVAFEMAKVMLPTIVSIAAYEHFQKRILEFEENGRINSTAGRELHLPKFWK